MTTCQETKQIKYYALDKIDKDTILGKMDKALAYLDSQELKSCANPEEFVQKMFDQDDISDMLIHLSRLPVFDKEFAEALKENLDLLATAKKLKYFTNLSLGQNAILFKNMADYLNKPLSI